MFKEGAHGYIRKTSGKSDLKTAIEMAMRNEIYFPSDLKQFITNKDQLFFKILIRARINFFHFLKYTKSIF
jgi:DNA-binding NarL/FixJ family response regulator